MAVTSGPCINAAGEIVAGPPLTAVPNSDGSSVTISIAPGDDGEILGTIDGVVQWVDAGQATGEVSSIATVAPMSADQPQGNVTLQLDPGADGNLLATVGGAVQWVDPTAEGIATQQYVLDQVGPVQTEVTANTNAVTSLGNEMATKVTQVGNASIVYGTDGSAQQAIIAYASTVQPGNMMVRDAAGRAQVADPEAAQDIATKNYVDTGFVAHGEGTPLKVWGPIGPGDPAPAGAVDGDVILRRTS